MCLVDIAPNGLCANLRRVRVSFATDLSRVLVRRLFFGSGFDPGPLSIHHETPNALRGWSRFGGRPRWDVKGIENRSCLDLYPLNIVGG